MSEGQRESSSLSKTQLSELAATAKQVEALYNGLPQDIEWAFRDDKLHLLQSRPITRLPVQPIEVSWEVEGPNTVYIRRQLVELMLDPLSTLFEDMYLKLFVKPRFVTLNGYAYTTMQWDFDGPQDRGLARANRGQTTNASWKLKRTPNMTRRCSPSRWMTRTLRPLTPRRSNTMQMSGPRS